MARGGGQARGFGAAALSTRVPDVGHTGRSRLLLGAAPVEHISIHHVRFHASPRVSLVQLLDASDRLGINQRVPAICGFLFSGRISLVRSWWIVTFSVLADSRRSLRSGATKQETK